MNNQVDEKSVLVAVYMITYNHIDFIEQAIKSVLTQKTNFHFKIFLGDDCSSDGTSEICKKISQEYLDLISYERNEKNIGAVQNATYTFNRCFKSGAKYIALLEGDDYWTNENKLQMQYDFLEKDKNIALSSHNSNILLSNGNLYLFNKRKKYLEGKPEAVYSINDYIDYPFFHASSIFFRRDSFKEFPEWFTNVFGGDFFLVLLIAMHGDIHFINNTFSVYRNNYTSISNYSSRHEILKNFDVNLSKFDKYSGYKYHSRLEERKFSLKYGLHYYHPNYLKKLWFATINFKKILRMNPDIVSKSSRFRIFIPTLFLRSKVNLFEKK